MPLLDGRTAVVTGGAQGIGFAIAERYVAEGARVVLGDLDLTATQAAVEKLGGNQVATAVRCDVTDAAEVEALIAAAVTTFGGLDVMVNNAGITRDATMRKMTEEQFDQVISVHLKGTWNGTRKAADVMRENKSGAIVNISSISGKVGLIGQTNYSAAKAGIVGLTKAAAKEVAHLGVRINAIQPGLIRSAMTEAMPQRIWDAKLAEIPMARAGEPDEVAKVALFLASDLSSYMTGTVLEVTGVGTSDGRRGDLRTGPHADRTLWRHAEVAHRSRSRRGSPAGTAGAHGRGTRRRAGRHPRTLLSQHGGTGDRPRRRTRRGLAGDGAGHAARSSVRVGAAGRHSGLASGHHRTERSRGGRRHGIDEQRGVPLDRHAVGWGSRGRPSARCAQPRSRRPRAGGTIPCRAA